MRVHVKKNQRGSSLIEAIIATAILALIMVSVVSLTSLTLKNQRMSAGQSDAVRLATEGIEWIRSMRDGWGWGTFSSTMGASSRFCLKTLTNKDGFLALSGSSFADVDCPTAQMIPLNRYSYSRILGVVANDAASKDNYTITVEVRWTEGGKTFSTTQRTVLYEWK